MRDPTNKKLDWGGLRYIKIKHMTENLQGNMAYEISKEQLMAWKIPVVKALVK